MLHFKIQFELQSIDSNTRKSNFLISSNKTDRKMKKISINYKSLWIWQNNISSFFYNFFFRYKNWTIFKMSFFSTPPILIWEFIGEKNTLTQRIQFKSTKITHQFVFKNICQVVFCNYISRMVWNLLCFAQSDIFHIFPY